MSHVSKLPRFALAPVLLILALAVWSALSSVGPSPTRATADRAGTVLRCGAPIVPTSPQAREAAIRRVAQEHSRDSAKLARQEQILANLHHRSSPATQRAKRTIRRLKNRLRCLAGKVVATLSIAVSGNHLVGASGKIVTLHGVDISRSQWACLYGHAFESPTNEASIAAMVSWHINAVRIPINEDCWLGINGAPIAVNAFREAIRGYVNRLHAYGIYAILDLHWSAPGSTLSHLGPGFAGFYEMADETHAPAFWESVASYFESDHAVIFDLFNEPTGISWRCWLNGCVAPRGYQTAGMQQLVEVVRKTGATQPVMIGGLEGASQLGSEWLVNHPIDPARQLVASVHVYSQTNVGIFNNNIGTVAAQFPIVAGETGDTSCVENDFNAFLPWADAHLVSYLAWAWTTGECESYMPLISNYSGTPTAYGRGYREHLLKTFPAPSA